MIQTILIMLYGEAGGLSYRYHCLCGRTSVQAALIARKEMKSGYPYG